MSFISPREISPKRDASKGVSYCFFLYRFRNYKALNGVCVTFIDDV